MTSDWSPDELELIDRYLAGVATLDEEVRVEGLLARDPESARRYRVAVEALSQHSAPRPDGRDMWGRFWGRISASADPRLRQTDRWRSIGDLVPRERGQGEARRPRRRISGLGTQPLRRWLGLGGTVVTVAVVGALFFLSRSGAPMQSHTARVYTTTTGQQATITLDDGTQVALAPQTTLRLIDFGAQSRTVELEHGEAYFTVAHTSGAPFQVSTGAVMTRVLGTQFLVHRIAEKGKTRVSVTDGKVRMTLRTQSDTGITLVAGQIGDVTDSTSQVTAIADVVPDAEWAPGQLVVRHTPVSKILEVVSRWYGYQFRYSDDVLVQQRVTMGISTESSAEALAAIEQVLAVSLRVTGDTVTLIPLQTRPVRGTHPKSYDVWTPTREVGR